MTFAERIRLSNGGSANCKKQARKSTGTWPARVGILNDYVRIPYANGSSFASQFLYREISRRGCQVSVIGPHDPEAKAADLPPESVCLPSVPLRNHPGVHLPLPFPNALAEIANRNFDLLLGQTTTELADLGVWLRYTQRVPFLVVNTVHFPSVYNVILPDGLLESRAVRSAFERGIIPWLERHTASVYNQTDGLIVLCRGLEKYWRDRGVTVPIHVIPRSVEPKIFDRPAQVDPFDPRAPRGGRLLVVCRHTREKNVVRLLRLFAERVAPFSPHATLTLVGDGPDHDAFREEAERLGVADRTFFPGEYPVTAMPDWYRNADVFVYTSLSETYGQVVSEALWCGLPVVAFDDGMGVAHQVEHGSNGYLLSPTSAEGDADFAAAVRSLLDDKSRRVGVSAVAKEMARLRSDPNRCVDRYFEAFESARRHCANADFGKIKPYGALSRWTCLHLLTAGLGLVRPPAVVNRHGRKQPSWTEIGAGTSAAKVAASAGFGVSAKGTDVFLSSPER